MPLTYNKAMIGKLTIEQTNKDGKHRYEIQIRQGNALAVLIHSRKATNEEGGKGFIHTLYGFYADEQHLRNMYKEHKTVLFDKVVKCELNTYFKESKPLLKYFTLSGVKVTCYYKEDKNKENGFNWQ